METTTEQRSTQRWQRLRRAAASKELLPAAEIGSWDQAADRRVGGDGDGGLEAGDPTTAVRGWRWLKAVSMVVFSARANNKTTETEPLFQPQESRSDESLMAALPRTTAQPASLPPQQPAEFGSQNPVPEVVVDVASSRAPEVADAAHGNPDDETKEQRDRCLKYSQRALGFAVCTFVGYASQASHTGRTTFKMAMAPFFVAVCADLLSLKTKAKLLQGSGLVYLSSFHLILMIYLIFITFDMDHAYAILFLPLAVGASHLQRKLWPGAAQEESSADKGSKDLDSIFELSALILNWSSFISAIIAVITHFISREGNEDEFAPGAVGFLFFLTIVLGLYLMLATTLRTLNLPTKYLDVLLICLLVSTLIATMITFSGGNWKQKQSPAGGSS